jgi:hypothetical protein
MPEASRTLRSILTARTLDAREETRGRPFGELPEENSARGTPVGNVLAALDAGRYGTCRYCKGRIDHSRLEALPEAPFCLPCQESFEA